MANINFSLLNLKTTFALKGRTTGRHLIHRIWCHAPHPQPTPTHTPTAASALPCRPIRLISTAGHVASLQPQPITIMECLRILDVTGVNCSHRPMSHKCGESERVILARTPTLTHTC